jgi:hypothetical protein
MQPIREVGARLHALEKGLFWGSIVAILGMCLFPATRARYILPALVPLTVWAVMKIRQYVGRSAPAGRTGDIVTIFLLVVIVASSFILPAVFHLTGPARIACWCLGGFLTIFGNRLLSQSWPQPLFVRPALLLGFLALLLSWTYFPWDRSRDVLRPMAAQILNHMPNKLGSIAALDPGPQPMLFYLGPDCVEASKVSEFPPDTSYALVPPKNWETPQLRQRLENKGFVKEHFRIKDTRMAQAREYIVVGKEESSAP